MRFFEITRFFMQNVRPRKKGENYRCTHFYYIIIKLTTYSNISILNRSFLYKYNGDENHIHTL